MFRKFQVRGSLYVSQVMEIFGRGLTVGYKFSFQELNGGQRVLIQEILDGSAERHIKKTFLQRFTRADVVNQSCKGCH